MMKYLPRVTAMAMVAGAVLTGTAASAASLVFVGGTGGLTAGQSDYANFDTTFGSYTTTGTAGLFTGTTSGVSAEPAFGDQGDQYFYVSGGGTATFSFGVGASSFGFDLGSADDYNAVTVFFAGGGSQTFTGAQLNPPGPATGNQMIAQTNGRVTIFGNGAIITSARFSSGQPSFEFDNIGIAAVPEPATWAMLILGFGVIGGAMRRSKVARTALRFA